MNKNSGIKKTTRSSLKNIAGWIGVGITLTISGIWAYWGAIENFHEGWYSESLWANIGMMLFQYLLFTFIFVILAVIALKWRKIGLFLHIAVAGFCIWFFSGASFSVLGLLIVMPIIGLGLIYFFGEPKPKKWAYGLLVCVPLIIIISVSVPSGIKVSRRMNDNDFGPRLI
ncbi:MAG: DUF1566 domain-containing protein, partial [Eubacteriales bacterium]|nr:DUF1566 domain-containing protein [Eubacteriales bacterium]